MMMSFASLATWAKSIPVPRPLPAPTDKAQLGIHAKRLLDDPVMQLAFERVAEGLVATWRKSGAADQEGRETAYRMLWALQAVQDKLRGFAGNNTLVAAEVRRKEAEEKRKRS